MVIGFLCVPRCLLHLWGSPPLPTGWLFLFVIWAHCSCIFFQKMETCQHEEKKEFSRHIVVPTYTGNTTFFFFNWKIVDSFGDIICGGGLVAESCLTLVTLWTVAHQAPLSMRFLRQEYWSGLPILSPGNLPNPGIEPASSAWQVDSLPLSHLGSPK